MPAGCSWRSSVTGRDAWGCSPRCCACWPCEVHPYKTCYDWLMFSIAVAILGLALLIVLHEGGHFLVARLCGMRVERFSIGFGNPLVSFKRGQTIYQIAPIPLGGFVQITGLNPHEDFDHNDPYVYPNRPRWMRLAVLVAGPGANYFTAVVLAFGIFLGFGKLTNTTTVDEVLHGTPAEAVGLQRGDV